MTGLIYDKSSSTTGTDVDSQDWHRPNFPRCGEISSPPHGCENGYNNPLRRDKRLMLFQRRR
jgi:hypothetical protein